MSRISPATIRFFAAAALGAVSACAAAGTPGAPPQRTRACRPAAEPRELPAAAALVDSAALVNDAARAWRRAGIPAGHVLFSMRYDRHGLNVRREVLEHGVTRALADTLQALAFAHRRTVARADREWNVRLRMELGDTPLLRVARSENCAPALRDPVGSTFTGVANRGWGDVRDPFPTGAAGNPSTVWLRVAVDDGGNVTDVRVERGPVRGNDPRLFAVVRAMDFDPATEDGHPVAGSISIPVRLP
jgi:TonB family protein